MHCKGGKSVLLLFWLMTTLTRLNGQDTSYCCTSVLLKSLGEARIHQGNRLGEFRLTGIYNERPLYSSTSSSSGEEYLFYLVRNNKGLWMVGPEPGQSTGGLAHSGDSLCVENLAEAQWKYSDGKSWIKDQQIKASCLKAKL